MAMPPRSVPDSEPRPPDSFPIGVRAPAMMTDPATENLLRETRTLVKLPVAVSTTCVLVGVSVAGATETPARTGIRAGDQGEVRALDSRAAARGGTAASLATARAA